MWSNHKRKLFFFLNRKGYLHIIAMLFVVRFSNNCFLATFPHSSPFIYVGPRPLPPEPQGSSTPACSGLLSLPVLFFLSRTAPAIWKSLSYHQTSRIQSSFLVQASLTSPRRMNYSHHYASINFSTIFLIYKVQK